MLEGLGQLGRRSARAVTAPLRKLGSVAGSSSRELARVVSNGGSGLKGVVTDGPRARGGDSRFRDDADLVDDGADVLLDVPVLKVDEIELEVEDLEARVSLQAELADLVKLNVGADVRLGKVNLDIEGVEAQALLKVRLDQVAAILDRALTTIDSNPQILEKLADTVETTAGEVGGTAQQALGEGGAASKAIDRVGDTAQDAVGEGGAVSEAVGEGGAVGEAAQGAGEAAGKAAEGTVQGAQQAADGVSESVQQTAQGATEGVQEATGESARAPEGLAGSASGQRERSADGGRSGGSRSSSGGGRRPLATDAARRRARESGVDLRSIEGTGSGGRITVTDVRQAAG